MIELWGLRRDYFQRQIGGSFEPEDTRELLATFSTEALAKSYVKSSELNPSMRSSRYRFRKGSLLRYYDSYEICSGSGVPHDPVMDFVV
jgi:hypothetical protein